MTRAVVRWVADCPECGIQQPDEFPTPEDADAALVDCPCHLPRTALERFRSSLADCSGI